MRAALSKAPGAPLVVEDVAMRAPGVGEVRLRVEACALNFPDTLMVEDRYQLKPDRPFAPGGEVAGVVEAVGGDAGGLRIGQKVIGWCLWGGLAESLVLPAQRCIPVPDGMPMDEAASLLLTYGTAHYALRQRAALQRGDTLLVTGAAGGVGLAAVELGRAWGARVVAAVSTQEKLAFAMRHGASAGVVYPYGPLDRDGSKSLAKAVKEAVGPAGANVVMDVVGGDIAEPCLRAIAWEGRFLVVGFPGGIPRLPLNLVLLKGCQVVGVSWGDWIARRPEDFEASVAELFELYAAGRIRPHVSQRFPLARVNEAMAMLSGRKALGKIVVTMESGDNDEKIRNAG